MKITNLTRHKATPEQVAAGVEDIENTYAHSRLIMNLTFRELPTAEEIRDRAHSISLLASGGYAMIGGAPYLMSELERALIERDIIPLYAFSARVAKIDVNEHGNEIKTSVFRHIGFVQV